MLMQYSKFIRLHRISASPHMRLMEETLLQTFVHCIFQLADFSQISRIIYTWRVRCVYCITSIVSYNVNSPCRHFQSMNCFIARNIDFLKNKSGLRKYYNNLNNIYDCSLFFYSSIAIVFVQSAASNNHLTACRVLHSIYLSSLFLIYTVWLVIIYNIINKCLFNVSYCVRIDLKVSLCFIVSDQAGDHMSAS